jgi:hypothetical protein
MELRDVMADVILARVAKQVEFGLVGAENSPVGRYRMQRDDAILKKVLEILRVLAELSFDPLVGRLQFALIPRRSVVLISDNAASAFPADDRPFNNLLRTLRAATTR